MSPEKSPAGVQAVNRVAMTNATTKVVCNTRGDLLLGSDGSVGFGDVSIACEYDT
jgi:hypothetical protein